MVYHSLQVHVHRVLLCSHRLFSSLDVHHQLHSLFALERVLGTGRVPLRERPKRGEGDLAKRDWNLQNEGFTSGLERKYDFEQGIPCISMQQNPDLTMLTRDFFFVFQPLKLGLSPTRLGPVITADAQQANPRLNCGIFMNIRGLDGCHMILWQMW